MDRSSVRDNRLASAAACAVLLSVMTWGGTARAEGATWLSSGGGVLAHQGGAEDSLTLSPAMTIDLGVGTDADRPFIFGGLFRVEPVFGYGADLALLGRVAHRSFQSAPIGIAVDLGAYQRWWGTESTGFVGEGVVGLPLGLQLSLMGTVGSADTWGFGSVLALDLARLTVHRGHLLDYWPNPQPSDAIGTTARR